MKGLLVKDYKAIMKQTKLYLLFIVIAACFPNTSMLSFALIYSTMMPMTVLAFDERSKWDMLAVMMPYTPSELVVSKYVFGYITIALTAILSIIARLVWGLFGGEGASPDFLATVLLLACAGFVLESISMPLLFKMGVEKGRLVLVFFVVAAAVASASSAETLLKLIPQNAPTAALFMGAVIIAALLNLLSIMLSVRYYKSKAK